MPEGKKAASVHTAAVFSKTISHISYRFPDSFSVTISNAVSFRSLESFLKSDFALTANAIVLYLINVNILAHKNSEKKKIAENLNKNS